ncbi:MAG: hypothetical protein AABZ31_02920, partial [Bdellovibrionota bacterium]
MFSALNKSTYLIGFFLILALQPNPSSAQALKPLGSPTAPAGGTFYLLLNAEPSTLNPFSGATDAIQMMYVDTFT